MKIITISGLPGSGKSAVAKAIAAQGTYHFVSIGQLQRQQASRRGMTTLELNRYAETDPGIDREMDELVRRLGREDRALVLDARMGWHFIPQALKVFLKVDPSVAASRICADDREGERYASAAVAREELLRRRASENRRFMKLYGVDCDDLSNYDLVLDTSHLSIAETTGSILEAAAVDTRLAQRS